MSKALVYKENYQEWRIEVYMLSPVDNHFQFSCYNPRGENVDHLKNPDQPLTLFKEMFALSDAKALIDRLIRDSQKNYQLWQTVTGQEDLLMDHPYLGTKEEALRIFDAQMLGWRTLERFYMTENGRKVMP